MASTIFNKPVSVDGQMMSVVDIEMDLPNDPVFCLVPNLATEHHENFYAVVKKLNLPFERGARRYYIEIERIQSLIDELETYGIEVCFSGLTAIKSAPYRRDSSDLEYV